MIIKSQLQNILFNNGINEMIINVTKIDTKTYLILTEKYNEYTIVKN